MKNVSCCLKKNRKQKEKKKEEIIINYTYSKDAWYKEIIPN